MTDPDGSNEIMGCSSIYRLIIRFVHYWMLVRLFCCLITVITSTNNPAHSVAQVLLKSSFPLVTFVRIFPYWLPTRRVCLCFIQVFQQPFLQVT